MSNTVKIKNRKKKSEFKFNYKLLAAIFGVFIAIIIGIAVWASYHWGVGMGTVGVRPVDPEENAAQAASEIAAQFATDGVQVVTPEQLEEMGVSVDGTEEADGAEAAGGAMEAAEEAPAADAAAPAEEAPAEETPAEAEAPADAGE